jgi:RNA polymerase sigma-70 factor (ECF subfamily)
LTTVSVTTLLEHREWVRRLARTLARDEATAEDIEQDAWVAAISRPPGHASSLRAWLGRVTRNLAFNRRRAASRRTSHERTAARPEALRSPAEVLAEAEAHRRLVEVVLALAEPYRATVLLRYFEDLRPREVALKMGVPPETVRTRTRRALELLREGLTGQRGSWMSAIAPIALAPRDVASCTMASAASASIAGGGTIMTGKATIVAATALALAAGYAGGSLSTSAGGSSPDGATLAEMVDRLASLEAGHGPVGAPTESLRLASSSEASAALASPALGSDLDARLRVLEAGLASARKANAELIAWASGIGPAPRDPSSEVEGWKTLSDAELLAEIRKFSTARGKTKDDDRLLRERVLDASAVFLERRTETLARAEVQTIVGNVWVRAGEAGKAEAALGEALRLTDLGTPVGVQATVQLAFAANLRKDNRRAADLLLSVANRTGAPASEQAWARFAAATYVAATDPASGIADLRAVLRDFGDSEDAGVGHWVAAAKKEMERLEGKAASR